MVLFDICVYYILFDYNLYLCVRIFVFVLYCDVYVFMVFVDGVDDCDVDVFVCGLFMNVFVCFVGVCEFVDVVDEVLDVLCFDVL